MPYSHITQIALVLVLDWLVLHKMHFCHWRNTQRQTVRTPGNSCSFTHREVGILAKSLAATSLFTAKHGGTPCTLLDGWQYCEVLCGGIRGIPLPSRTEDNTVSTTPLPPLQHLLDWEPNTGLSQWVLCKVELLCLVWCGKGSCWKSISFPVPGRGMSPCLGKKKMLRLLAPVSSGFGVTSSILT